MVKGMEPKRELGKKLYYKNRQMEKEYKIRSVMQMLFCFFAFLLLVYTID